eukprot:CAMPEP_0183716596 /NCGR_PEP_ID=MMETSP0737-20130205/10450_1 /TAXON_ID=385413 /ORGANISM="Thalassiosira miniscula, Strain CCMP1093" /LENGTH=878 /DNA_ID=CAMNT_0025945889 /DNA_START=12 /DNA_END=2648 /DNA_ORIENTATION=-
MPSKQTNNGSSANNAKTIPLSSNNKKSFLTVPSWMTFHHLPEYGIIASSKSSSSSSGDVAVGGGGTAELSSTSGSSSSGPHAEKGSGRGVGRPRGKRRRTSNDQKSVIAASNNSAPNNKLLSASNHHIKTKKELAMDSLDPPTAFEINGHDRHLTEEAMGYVGGVVDDCVGHALKYSATTAIATTAQTKNNATSLHAGGTDERMRSSSNNNNKRGEEKNWMTLAEEIRHRLHQFQPQPHDMYDNDDDVNAEASSTSDAKETEAATPKQRFHKPRSRDDASSTIISREEILSDMMMPKTYDPTLLPFISIQCYPNILDRGEMVRGLALDLSKKRKKRQWNGGNGNDGNGNGSSSNGSSSNNNGNSSQQNNPQHQQISTTKTPCVVTLRSTSDLVRQGHLITELLSQCLSSDPHGEAYALELQKQKKRHKSNHYGGIHGGVLIRSMWDWTRSLIEWAGGTEVFDSIVVILEDPEKIPSPTLDSFLTTMTSLRSDHGVPISVIVMDATPGGLGDRLSHLRDPCLRGTSGVVMSELFVPLPQVQLELFVNKLFSSKCLPTLLWKSGPLWRHIQELFQECDNSIVSVAKQLKTQLRRYFALPSAYVSLLNYNQFTIPNLSRITWLFGDGHGSASTKDDREDGRIFELFHKMQSSYLYHQFCQRLHFIFHLSPLGKIEDTSASEFHSKSRMQELLVLLGTVRKRVTLWNEAPFALFYPLAMPCKKLNEFIILVGKFAMEEEPNASMARALVNDIMTWATEQFTTPTTLEEYPTVQPRRAIAKALSSMPPDALANCPLSNARRVAFQVFQSRVITLADWHERYFDAVMNNQENGHDLGGAAASNEAAFFFAVYELIHCGFVRKLTTARRKEEAYEKIAIVWGSGR